MRRISILLPLAAVACKAPPDAPQELDELVGYLYEHAGDEDTEALAAGVGNLSGWLQGRIDETVEGYSVNNLTDEAVDSLEDGHRDLSGLAGAAVGHASPFPYDVVGTTAAMIAPDVLYPDTYEDYVREYRTDPACFPAQVCGFMEFETESTSRYALGLEVSTNSIVQFRWIDTPAGRALVERTWLHSPAEVNLDFLDVKEQFYLWVFLPDVEGGSGSVSLQATWIVAQISGGEVPEGLALQLVVDSMSNSAATLDEYIEAHSD